MVLQAPRSASEKLERGHVSDGSRRHASASRSARERLRLTLYQARVARKEVQVFGARVSWGPR